MKHPTMNGLMASHSLRVSFQRVNNSVGFPRHCPIVPRTPNRLLISFLSHSTSSFLNESVLTESVVRPLLRVCTLPSPMIQ